MPTTTILPGFFHALLLTLVASWTTVIWYLIAEGLHSVVAGAVSILVGVGVVGWLAAHRVPPPRPGRLGLRAVPARHVAPVVLLVPMIVVALEIQALVRAVSGAPAGRGHHEWNPGMVDAGSGGALLLSIVLFVLVLPPVIELFFRGLLHEGMVERFGRGRGTVVAAGLYTLFVLSLTFPKELFAHWAARWAALIVAALVWGLVLGAVRQVTGSVIATTALHAAGNLIWIVLVAVSDTLPLSAVSSPGRHVPATILVPSVISVAAGLWLLARSARRPATPVSFAP